MAVTRQGVEVEQTSNTATTPVAVPVFLPVMVGPCKEIVEAQTSGAANPRARVSVAATIMGANTDATKDVSGLSVVVSLGGDANQEVEFPLSPTGSELATSLVATLLDEGITGATVSSVGDAITITTVAKGDDASLHFKKGKVRVTHGSVTGGPYAVGDAALVSSEPVGTITYVGDGFVILDTFGTLVDVSASDSLVVTVGTKSATVAAVLTAYDALGLEAYLDVTITGASSYRNREVAIPFSSLPVSRGTVGYLDYDAESISILRSQGGALKALARDAAVLRSRAGVGPTTRNKTRAVAPSGASPSSATAVVYTTVDGVDGTGASVQHLVTYDVPYDALVGTFAVGETVCASVAEKILGRVVADTGSVLTLALWGSASSSDLADNIAIYGQYSEATAAVNGSVSALASPAVVTESLLLALTVSDAADFAVGTTLLNGTATNNRVTIGTILDVNTADDVLTVAVTGYRPGRGDSVRVGSVATTVSAAVSELSEARALTVFAGTTATAARVADAVNRADTGLFIADVGGASWGGSTFPTSSGGLDGSITMLEPIAVDVGDPALTLFSGAPYDDRNGDAKTPYFWTPGSYARLTHGAGNAALTFTARGAQNLAAPGNYHGAHGNGITVSLVPCEAATILISVVGTAITVRFGSHTASQIATALAANSLASALVIATAGGTGAGTPEGLYLGKLTGGRDPVNLQAAPASCVVLGERDLAHFGYIRLVVSDASAVTTGETLRLNDSSGAVVGVVREAVEAAGVLWVDPTWHSGTAAGVGASTLDLASAHAILVDDVYIGWQVTIVSGTGAGQTRTVTDYAASTRRVTLDTAWSTQPSGAVYSIIAPADASAGDTLYGMTSEASVTCTAAIQEGIAAGDTLTVSVGGGVERTITFPAATTQFSAIYGQLDVIASGFCTVYPELASRPDAVLKLNAGALSGQRTGIESTIVLGGTAVEKLFGLIPGGVTYAGVHEGAPMKVLVGDEVFNAATSLGSIVAVEDVVVGSRTFTKARLRLSSNTLPTTASYTQWWVKAKRITLGTDLLPKQVGGNDRPKPGIVVDTANSRVIVSQAQARLADGRHDASATQYLYADYTATRTDLAAKVHTYSKYSDMEAAIGPVSPSNPLAWATYMAMLNATNVQVGAVGVTDASAAYPEGTLEAYIRSLEVLASQEAYILVPLTQNRDVGDAFDANVIATSAVGGRKERIVFRSEQAPTEKESTIAGTGSGLLTDVNTVEVSAADLNIVDALVAAGIEDPESLSWSDLKAAGVYLQISSNVHKYSISSISGQVVTLATANFEPGENTDGFYWESALDPNNLDMAVGGESVSVKVRGAAVTPATLQGREDIIAALAQRASSIASKRTRFVQPAQVGVSYAGSDRLVPSYYACAALAGMVANFNASQSLTDVPIQGIKSVSGSSGVYTPEQLDAAMDGGVWWLVQERPGAQVTTYHQVTTDTSTVEKTEHSIVTAIDWFAMSLRNTTRSITGKNNIDDRLLDLISIGSEGACRYAEESNVIAKAAITGIEQVQTAPDQVLVEAIVKPRYPCNKVKFVIQT